MDARELTAAALALVLHGALLYASSVSGGDNLLFDAAVRDGEPIEIEIESASPSSSDLASPVVPAPAVLAPAVLAPAVLAPGQPKPESPAAIATDPTTTRSPATSTPGASAPPGPAAAPSDVSPEPELAAASNPGAASNLGTATPGPGSPDEYGGAPPVDGGWGGFGLPTPSWTLPGGLQLGAGPAAPTQAPRAAELDGAVPAQVLASTLRDRDKDLGLVMPSQSVVASAVSVVSRTVNVPHNTRATFEVRIGENGKVISSRVLKHSAGDAEAWSRAAKSVAASLATQHLDLGAVKGKGATVMVSVTTKHVFAAGTTKAADIKPVCANQIINDLADAASDRPDTEAGAAIPMFTDENGRPCIPIGVGGVADLANLGSKKQVVIQTSSEVLIDGKKALPSQISPVNTDPAWVNDPTKTGPRAVAPFKMRKHKRDKEKKK